MNTNRLFGLVAGIVALLALAAIVVPAVIRSRAQSTNGIGAGPAGANTGLPDRTLAPLVDGRVLAAVSVAGSPPEPTQWEAGPGGIPSNTWWSSAVTGPGSEGMWPLPLGVRITPAGEVQVAAPAREVAADGSSDAPFVPALFLESPAAMTTSVVGYGPLHVTLRLTDEAGHQTDLTLVQGSPLIEVYTDQPISLRIPGLDLPAEPASGIRSLRFDTSAGPWMVGSADPATMATGADRLTIETTASGRFVVGPVPEGADGGYDGLAAEVAAHPLLATTEDLEVGADGSTTQILTQDRTGGTGAQVASLWALQPHHQDLGVALPDAEGTLNSPSGVLPVVAASDVRIEYPAVPILWSAVPLPGGQQLPDDPQVDPGEGLGSYFGGKAAYQAAARSDAWRRAETSTSAADDAAEVAAKLLDRLAGAQGAPSLRWDPLWGSAVIEPAEFGSGTDLNDHQLQYGYWVAAAAHLAEVDPDAGDRYHDLVDLLVAEYAGAEAVPGASNSLPDQRTWSPYSGHSWASGTARFAAGNNLESISESSLAWWAAARWMLATDRPDAARTFVGRFTIEAALTGYWWLPQGDQLPAAEVRPWSGVVWSSKIDTSTWFDPQDESALGIRLLPVGPAGLARYSTQPALDAAKARWRWCDTSGGGCTVRWGNLLDSDAVVAGRPPQVSPDPEPSTSATMSAWWRDLWERSSVAIGWSCTVGTVARQLPDGSVVVLASNPGPSDLAVTCRDSAGVVRWSDRIAGHGVTSATLAP